MAGKLASNSVTNFLKEGSTDTVVANRRKSFGEAYEKYKDNLIMELGEEKVTPEYMKKRTQLLLDAGKDDESKMSDEEYEYYTYVKTMKDGVFNAVATNGVYVDYENGSQITSSEQFVLDAVDREELGKNGTDKDKIWEDVKIERQERAARAAQEEAEREAKEKAEKEAREQVKNNMFEQYKDETDYRKQLREKRDVTHEINGDEYRDILDRINEYRNPTNNP